jgi:hypothetical protein
MQVIGENETIDSQSFLDRNKNRRGYTGSKCAIENYEWAELKSSLLMKELTKNDKIHEELVIFCQNIIIMIFNSLNIDLNDQLDDYMDKLKTSNQKDDIYNYPIGQSHVWQDNKNGLWNDFYALYNFLKWVWINLNDGIYYNVNSCKQLPIFYRFIIDMFQQQMFIFIDMIRGDRFDFKYGETTDHIGISTLNIPYLKHTIRGYPSYKVEPWEHPGETQCRVPYRGKYGEHIKNYKKNNSFYASLQCGISGSTQYTLFLYLMSIAESGTKDVDRDIRNVIISACLILTGDGGHNIREVLFGLICSVTILYNFITDLKGEIQKIFNNKLDIKQNISKIGDVSEMVNGGELCKKIVYYITENIQDIYLCRRQLNFSKKIKNIFLFLLNSCSSWEPFISTFYNYTKNINIVGVSKDDLDKYNPNLIRNADRVFLFTKNKLYDNFFDVDKNMKLTYGKDTHINIQIFFALDNKRYLINNDDSFKNAANDFIEKIVKNYPLKEGYYVIKKVNNKLKKQLKKCKERIENPNIVPFAFSKKSRSRVSKKLLNR